MTSPAANGRARAATFTPCDVFVMSAISLASAPISAATSDRERAAVAKISASVIVHGARAAAGPVVEAAVVRAGSGPVDALPR